jgi:hypothetical protein
VLTKEESRNIMSALGFKSNEKHKNQELEQQLIDGLIQTAVTNQSEVRKEDLL